MGDKGGEKGPTQSVPIMLLHEGEGHIVTIELKNGETYRGLLTESEDSMNCQLKEGKFIFAPIKYLFFDFKLINLSYFYPIQTLTLSFLSSFYINLLYLCRGKSSDFSINCQITTLSCL